MTQTTVVTKFKIKVQNLIDDFLYSMGATNSKPGTIFVDDLNMTLFQVTFEDNQIITNPGENSIKKYTVTFQELIDQFIPSNKPSTTDILDIYIDPADSSYFIIEY